MALGEAEVGCLSISLPEQRSWGLPFTPLQSARPSGGRQQVQEDGRSSWEELSPCNNTPPPPVECQLPPTQVHRMHSWV